MHGLGLECLGALEAGGPAVVLEVDLKGLSAQPGARLYLGRHECIVRHAGLFHRADVDALRLLSCRGSSASVSMRSTVV